MEDTMQERAKWAIPLLLAGAILTAAAGQIQSATDFELVSTIAFASSRDNPTGIPLLSGEIYLVNGDGTNPRRLTFTAPNAGNLFAALSPDGKKIVFDSNRLRSATDPLNTSDLFLMETDGTNQTPLTRGSSAAWSPDSKYIAFHASASGTGQPIRSDPGAPTSDSDIFVANVDDLLAGVASPTNITNSPDIIDEDADWSPVLPDGTTKIVFARHSAGGSLNATELYVINPDGSGLMQLTSNGFEERAAAWSPDGSQIAFMCRIGPVNAAGVVTFEICVMDASGDANGTVPPRRLTLNGVLDATPSWSPDGTKIVLHRNPFPFQLWIVNADTTCDAFGCICASPYADGRCEMQLTNPPGANAFPHWGELRVHITK